MSSKHVCRICIIYVSKWAGPLHTDQAGEGAAGAAGDYPRKLGFQFHGCGRCYELSAYKNLARPARHLHNCETVRCGAKEGGESEQAVQEAVGLHAQMNLYICVLVL